jgi:pimeloyl-ACP methyl ester carboxylesterase
MSKDYNRINDLDDYQQDNSNYLDNHENEYEQNCIERSKFRTSNGLCLSYQYCDGKKRNKCGCTEDNCKPDIILIHGIGYDSNYWTCFFKKFCPVANVFAVDLPGAGDSESPTSKLTLDVLTQYIIELLNHLELDKVYLVGHGLGAIIALNIAAMHSSRVVKIAISSVSPLFYPLPGSEWTYYITLELQQLLAQFISPNADINAIALLLTNSIDTVDCDSKELLVNQYINEISQYQLYIPLLQLINFIPLVSQITVPVLIMSGTKDPYVPFGATLYLREHIPNSAIVEFYGQGSNFPILDTGLYNESIFYFFFVRCDPCCEYLENIHRPHINHKCQLKNIQCNKKCKGKNKHRHGFKNDFCYEHKISIPCRYYQK